MNDRKMKRPAPRPAHEVILNRVEEAVKGLEQRADGTKTSDVEVLCEVLREFVSDKHRQAVIAKLREFHERCLRWSEKNGCPSSLGTVLWKAISKFNKGDDTEEAAR